MPQRARSPPPTRSCRAATRRQCQRSTRNAAVDRPRELLEMRPQELDAVEVVGRQARRLVRHPVLGDDDRDGRIVVAQPDERSYSPSGLICCQVARHRRGGPFIDVADLVDPGDSVVLDGEQVIRPWRSISRSPGCCRAANVLTRGSAAGRPSRRSRRRGSCRAARDRGRPVLARVGATVLLGAGRHRVDPAAG